ncbi:MAG TPA: hypothetical protein VHX88_07130 [Solirubrobacteraceae bacterium]|jgi:hypothetical protein|nr:hypothetical protein [Solirubrobacteraceae bacterium]
MPDTFSSSTDRGRGGRQGKRSRRLAMVAIGAVGVEAAWLRRRAGVFAGRVVVRCRAGHRFTTLWIPGASLTALRLGPWRIQRCPVGRHLSVVTPVARAAQG